MKLRGYSLESGRTLTEMLGVLAIMGVLTVVGIAGFNWAMDRWRANRIIDGVEERALVGSRLRLSGMNRTMEIADAVVAQTGGTIEDYATTVSNTGYNDEKTYFSVQVAGVSPQVCENVMNLNWQLPVEVYAGNTQYTGDTAICAGEGTVDLTFVFAADLITKKDVKVVDRNNPTCRPTQVWTCKENEDNHYNCCTAGMLCRADGDTLPTGVFSENKGNCPRGTHQCRNNQCVCRKSCPAGQNQDPKTCACSSQICETGVWNEAKGECVECNEDTDCAGRTDGKTTCDTASNVCKCPAGKVPNADGTACVECMSDTDCANRTDGKTTCDTTNNTCVSTYCTDNTDCKSSEYCEITETENCSVPTTSTCTILDSGTEATYNGKTFLYSSGSMTWWSARNWCLAHGKNLASLSDLSCSYSSYNCVDWGSDDWEGLIAAIGSRIYWMNDSDGPCGAFIVETSFQSVGAGHRNYDFISSSSYTEGYKRHSIFALCR